MELWDLYNIHRERTSEKLMRGNPIPDGRYRLVVHVCVFNSDGQMLIQHRQPTKAAWPDLWDVSVGGAVVSGETSTVAAHRETLEEIGLNIDFSNLSPSMSITFPDGFDDFYIVQQDVDISQLKLQEEEVQAVKWASLDEILSMVDAGTFIPYCRSFVEFLFFRSTHPGIRTTGSTKV